MSKKWIRRTSAAHGFLTGVWLLAAAGCSDHPPGSTLDPTAAQTALATLHANQPFYYYQGNRIPLEVDPSRLVIKASDPERGRAVAALQALNLQIRSRQAVPNRPGHEILSLARPASVAAVQTARDSLRQLGGIEFLSPVYRTVDGGEDFIPLNQIMVEFASGTSEAQIDELNRQFGTKLIREVNPDSAWFFHVLEFPNSLDQDPLELLAKLYEHPLVKWADVDKTAARRIQSVPTDPYYRGWQYYLYNTYQRNGIRVDINVEPAWSVTKGGGIPSAGGLRVAVIDDGVDASHQDLAVSFLGYDLFGNNTLGCTDCAFSPYGDDLHGTAVAGIIAAQHNGYGIAGIAPDAQIIPIRLFRNTSDPNPNNHQFAGDRAAAEAIDFAWWLADAHVINNSWGGGPASDAITAAIQRAITQGRGGLGAVLVFGAGNYSERTAGQYANVVYPASLAFALPLFSVGAINRYGDPADYTPRASFFTSITVVAPSGHVTGRCTGDVVTTDRWGDRGCQDGPNGDVNFTRSFSGTSAAAPQVAGAAALLLSKYPHLTAQEVVQRVRNAADSWGSSSDFGAGKLNIGRLFPPPPPPDPEPCIPEPPKRVCDDPR